MSYILGAQCCRFCRRLMPPVFSHNHLCDSSIRQLCWYFENVIPAIYCPICGYILEKFGCGTPGVAAMDAGKYMCYCPPALRLHSFGEAIADLVKLDDDVAELAKLIAGPQADFRKR